MAVTKLHYSFTPGTLKVTREDYPELKNRIYKFLGCSSDPEYYRKKKDYLNIPAHIKEGIEKIFFDFGVTNVSDIWDIWDTKK